MKNMKTLSDPPEPKEFELPFSVDLGADYDTPQLPTLIGAEIALAKPDGEDYVVATPSGNTRLQRDIDFGVIPGTKQPTLLKAGAEKVVAKDAALQARLNGAE